MEKLVARDSGWYGGTALYQSAEARRGPVDPWFEWQVEYLPKHRRYVAQKIIRTDDANAVARSAVHAVD